MASRVQVGQQFREHGRPYVWEVQAVFERPGEPTHVRLVQVGDHHRLKTIGIAALLDRQLYDPVTRAE